MNKNIWQQLNYLKSKNTTINTNLDGHGSNNHRFNKKIGFGIHGQIHG
jgi:hypothetical protein